jgi:hypothetical protein
MDGVYVYGCNYYGWCQWAGLYLLSMAIAAHVGDDNTPLPLLPLGLKVPSRTILYVTIHQITSHSGWALVDVC